MDRGVVIVGIGSSGRTAIEIIENESKDFKSVIITGTGNPFEEEEITYSILERKPIFTSPNGKHWSNFAPIDNRGNIIQPKGSKYHK